MAENGEIATGGAQEVDVGVQARRLLRAARSASLATNAAGQPFCSLVTPACMGDLAVLMFLSSLSEHTRHLRAEPRCALMVQGPPDGANPQTAPRVTVTGVAEVCADPAAKALWLSIHPYAALYAGFSDFTLWRVVPQAASLIGGFARAYRLGAAALLPDAGAVAAVGAAAAGVMAHCNGDHAVALDDLAQKLGGQAGAGWKMVAVDCDGCDLALGDVVWRCAWPEPVADADGVRSGLIRLLRQARN